MRYFKKLSAFILALCFILLSGCNKSGGSSSSEAETSSAIQAAGDRDYLTLLYSASDSFNPYTAATDINRQLCRLMYEPLIKLDNDFNVHYSIAQSAETDGTTCTVTLKDTQFSDGSRLTADDVVYSYNAAKNSSTEYAYKLYEVVSATASGSNKVIFSISKSDPYFVNLLDFPIIKKDSEKRKNDDGVEKPPIGAGRYVSDDEMTKLTVNPKFSGSGNFSIKEIRLINAPDSESVSHYVEIGATDMYYSDISDGKIVRMSGKKVSINLNRLVYIAVNSSYGDLGKEELRQAISSGIDRKTICRDGYYNNAIPAKGFYNPVWKPVNSVQNIETQTNREITIENLEKIGYNNVDTAGVRKNQSGGSLSFELLVNGENISRVTAAKLIASKLSEYGFKIRVAEKSFADYTASLASGNFQLCLAEVAITPNMDISSLITEGGSAAYGIKKAVSEANSEASAASDEGSASQDEQINATSGELLSGFYSGQNTVSDIASVLQTEMPLVPVCYRTGVFFYNDNIENVNNSSLSDIYFSIESYKFK